MSLLWRGVVRASFAALERHGPERVRIQRFERSAAAPEAEVRELCAWLGLAYEPALLEIPVVNSSYATTGEGRLERAGRALAGAALAGRGRDRAVGLRAASVELGYAPDDVQVSPARLALGLGNGSVRGRSRGGRQPPSGSARRRSTSVRARKTAFSREPL